MAAVNFGNRAHYIPEHFAGLGQFARGVELPGMFWHWIPFKKIILTGIYDVDELCKICTIDMLNTYELTEHFNELIKQLKCGPCPMCANQAAYFAQVTYKKTNHYGPIFYEGEFTGMLDIGN